MTSDGLTRRNALTGAATLGVAMPLLAACGGDGDAKGVDAAPQVDPGTTLGSASEIPVGGGKVFADESVVVTQPTAGDFKCFSAICTHQGCLVSRGTEGTIDCTCHASRFSIEDGSVQSGPAPSALAEVPISVEGDSIVID